MWPLALVLLVWVVAPAEEDGSPTIDEIIKLAAGGFVNANAYSAKIDFETMMMGLKMQGNGSVAAKGEQTFSEMIVNMFGQRMGVKSVVDSDGTIWTEMNGIGMPAIVMKIDDEMAGMMSGMMSGPMPSLTFMPGHNMAEYADVAGYLKKAREQYDFVVSEAENATGEPIYVISGAVDEDVQNEMTAFEDMGLLTSQVELKVGKADGTIRELTMKNKAGEELVKATFIETKLGGEVDDDLFVYTPPEGAQVMDVAKMAEGMGGFAASSEEKFAVGDTAPDFVVVMKDGNERRLSDFRGNYVLIDFWATWCGPCIHELPNVIEVYEEYHPEGFEIVGVSLDNSREDLDQFLKKYAKVTWPQHFDGKGWGNEVAELYGVNAIPKTYLLDKKGVIRHINLRGNKLKRVVGELYGAE